MSKGGWDDATRAVTRSIRVDSASTRERYLVCQAGPRRGEWIRLFLPRTVVGRGQSATVRFDDESISREHAEILLDGDRVIVADLGSRNGTLCNGAPVSRQEIRPGDQLTLGNGVQLAFVERHPNAAAPGSPTPAVAPEEPPPGPARKTALGVEVAAVQRIQSRLLPDQVEVEGMQLAARMIPSEEVGGDYYEVLPDERGCWIGIGDVAGHGFEPGLIMLMIQSCVATLGRQTPNATPVEFLKALNHVLYNNVRVRAGQDDHASLSVMRYSPDGLLRYAGAHEEVLVWRARTGRVERHITEGPFLGTSPEIERWLVERTIQLEPGDLLVLYSDGITEARSDRRELFEIERLCATIEEFAELPAEKLRDAILGRVLAFTGDHREDDMTLLVGRYVGQPGGRGAARP